MGGDTGPGCQLTLCPLRQHERVSARMELWFFSMNLSSEFLNADNALSRFLSVYQKA